MQRSGAAIGDRFVYKSSSLGMTLQLSHRIARLVLEEVRKPRASRYGDFRDAVAQLSGITFTTPEYRALWQELLSAPEELQKLAPEVVLSEPRKRVYKPRAKTADSEIYR